MNKEIIEKYIQFAIDNGFTHFIKHIENSVRFIGKGVFVVAQKIETNTKHNLIDLITSKEFIEAIARGMLIRKKGNHIYLKDGFIILPSNKEDEYISIISDRIIRMQALAIVNNKLKNFIKDILSPN